MHRAVGIVMLVVLLFIAVCEARCETSQIFANEFTKFECENKTKEQPEFCSLVWGMIKKWKQGLWKSQNPWLHWAEINIKVEFSSYKPQVRITAQSPGKAGLNSGIIKKKSAFLSADSVFKEFLGYVESNLMEFSLQTGPLQ